MPDPALEVNADFLIDGGLRAALALLDLPEPPTAIFAFNDPTEPPVAERADRGAPRRTRRRS